MIGLAVLFTLFTTFFTTMYTNVVNYITPPPNNVAYNIDEHNIEVAKQKAFEESIQQGLKDGTIRAATYNKTCDDAVSQPFLDALNKVATISDGRTGTKDIKLFDDMCFEATKVINQRCEPDPQQNPIWKDACTDFQGMQDWLLFRDIQNQNLYPAAMEYSDDDGHFSYMLNTYCPAAEKALSGSAFNRHHGIITNDLNYKMYCKPEPICLSHARDVKKATKEVDRQTNEDGKIQLLQSRLCPAMKAVLSEPACADMDKSWITDTLYWKNYCADSDCLPYHLDLIRAEADTKSAIASNPNYEPTVYQSIVNIYCPAAKAAVDNCKDSKLKELIMKNPYYRDYCSNLGCAALRHDLLTVEADFDYQVKSGINKSGQYHLLETKVCPAMKAVIDNTTCDPIMVTKHPYWKQYCADPSCIPLRDTVEHLENEFARLTDENAKYQFAINNLCPAYKAALDGCAPDSDLHQYIHSSPVWKQYCAAPECTDANYKLYMAQKDYDWQVSQNPKNKLQLLEKSLCPAMNNLVQLTNCNNDVVTNNPLWKDFCSDSPCLPLRQNVETAETDFSTIIDTDTQYQTAINTLCPTYEAALSGCNDSYHITHGEWYSQFCKSPECTALNYKLFKANKDYNYQVSTGLLTEYNQLYLLNNKLCPIMHEVADSSCEVDFTNDAIWNTYCHNSVDCLPSRIDMSRAETNMNAAISESSRHSIARQELCPAYQSVLDNCDIDDRILASKYYQDYCANPTCADDKYYYQTTIEQMPTDSPLEYLRDSLCPAMNKIMQDGCDSKEVTDNPYWNKYCEDSSCIPYQINIRDAEKQFNNQTNQGAMYQVAFNTLCPAYNAALSNCKNQNEIDYILSNANYNQYCKNQKCAEAAYELWTQQKSYNTSIGGGLSMDGQYDFLQNNLCPAMQSIVDTCDDSSVVTTDSNWTKYCSDAPCIPLRKKVHIAETGFAALLDQSAKYQFAESDLCPAYNEALSNCSSQDILDHITSNPNYNQYCKNPVCTSKQYNLYTTQQLYNNQSTANKYGKLDMLETLLCPAMSAVMNEPTCGSPLTDDPLWKQYCSDATCLPLRKQVVKSESTFDLLTDVTAKYQSAVSDLCPSYNAALAGCTSQDELDYITSTLNYQTYCANPSAAAADFNMYKAQTTYDSSINLLNESGKLQLLKDTVCPAMQSLLPYNDAKVNDNPLWQQYCQDSTCLPLQINMTNAEAAFAAHANDSENTKYQSAVNTLCPAYNAIISGCQNSDYVKNNINYQRYCANPTCAANLNAAFPDNLDYTFNNLNSSGKTEMLINQICPAFDTAIASCGLTPTVASSPYYKNYCYKSTSCLSNVQAVNNLIPSVDQVYNRTTSNAYTPAMKQQDMIKYMITGAPGVNLCGAFNNVLTSCGASPEDKQNVLNNQYYKDYCMYPSCVIASANVPTAQAALLPEYDLPTKLDVMRKTICPAFSAVMDSSCPTGVQDTLKTDPMYQQYCQYTPACLNAQYDVANVDKQMNYATSQGTYTDSQIDGMLTNYGMCTSKVPALETSCPSSLSTNWKDNNKWYQNYCKYPACTTAKSNWSNATSNWNYTYYYYNQNDNGRAQATTTLCPAFKALADGCRSDIATPLMFPKYQSQYDQCQPTAPYTGTNCPSIRYTRDSKLASLKAARAPGAAAYAYPYPLNWYSFTTDNVNSGTLPGYCNAANDAKTKCGTWDPSYYTTNPDYLKWCPANTTCRDNTAALNGLLLTFDQNFYIQYRNNGVVNQICPLVKNMVNTCPSATVTDYLYNKPSVWFDSMLTSCPVPSSTVKTNTVNVINNATGQCLTASASTRGAAVTQSACVPGATNQKWYRDTAFPNILRLSNAPSWPTASAAIPNSLPLNGISTQDLALSFNTATNTMSLNDSGSMNNRSWMRVNTPEGGAWSSQHNNQCFNFDASGNLILVACDATNPTFSTVAS